MKADFFLLIIFLALVSGCVKPPLAEMEAAREVVFRAENDTDAVLYAGDTLAYAQDALGQMRSEINSKRYNEARSHAAEAIAAAERAVADGRTRAIRAREETASPPAVMETEAERDDAGETSCAQYNPD